jgi:hypothetical protein
MLIICGLSNSPVNSISTYAHSSYQHSFFTVECRYLQIFPLVKNLGKLDRWDQHLGGDR